MSDTAARRNRPRHYQKRVPYPPGAKQLQEVLTVQEAAALWGRHPRTIRQHIYTGNLEARQTGRLYLISLASLVAYYGHSPLIRTSKTTKTYQKSE